MNPIPTIQRVILRCIHAAGNIPFPDAALNDAIDQVVVPKPLKSDREQAKRMLEANGFLQAARDDMDTALVTWTLTTKGTHKAIELNS